MEFIDKSKKGGREEKTFFITEDDPDDPQNKAGQIHCHFTGFLTTINPHKLQQHSAHHHLQPEQLQYAVQGTTQG